MKIPSESHQRKILKRVHGDVFIENYQLDKMDCSGWEVGAIQKLLVTPKKNGGIGLHPDQLVVIKLYGSHFENVVAALLRFKGDEEAKIEHACAELTTVDDVSVRMSIVRWIFANLLVTDITK